jgi:hypothetical protein
MALTLAYTRSMANLLLAGRTELVGVNWISKFVVRYETELKAYYLRRYDYRRALYEDPVLIGS